MACSIQKSAIHSTSAKDTFFHSSLRLIEKCGQDTKNKNRQFSTKTFASYEEYKTRYLPMVTIFACFIGISYHAWTDLEAKLEEDAKKRLLDNTAETKSWKHVKPLAVVGGFQEQDKLWKESGKMRTYSFREIEEKELIIKNGLLYQRGSPGLLDYSHGIEEDGPIIYNYIMLSNGKILIDEQRLEANFPWWNYAKYSRPFHTSISRDVQPIAAGEIIFIDGKVELLNEHSGHFQPRDCVHYIEEELKNRGAQFASTYKKCTFRDLVEHKYWGCIQVK